MSVDKTQYIGKHLAWDEAVDIFPNLWVSFLEDMYTGCLLKKKLPVLLDKVSSI